MDKFRKGLDGNDKSISKIPRYSQFQEIKTLHEEIFSSSLPVESSIRNKFYYLINVLTECQMLARKHGFKLQLSRGDTINRIRRELIKIKREVKVITDKKRSSHGNFAPQPNNGQASSQDRELLRWTTRPVHASNVHGFDDDVISMKKLLVFFPCFLLL
ncbi:hypothetical protein D8674_008942 [Pyrus ussuriensis x Pyrus communis]|uniref:Uncharacterized protein n=1 Tax=Pyrus ussuriensis x Pyrus communis TaxID=2448454 RepID=A0A5N5HX98_9ROSA|nr:hypothetical protein D8674_008942 [Pyrus ussuriensis x Pyrus communis]